MPKLNDQTMEEQPNVGHFGFSAVRLDELGATEYTLATIVLDTSGSVYSFINQIEEALKECVKALQYSPRSDNLMLRVVKFDTNHTEIHGFKLLENCQLDDYTNCLQPGGATVLCDASVDSIEAVKNYAQQLNSNDVDVNGIVVVVTDGMDNGSSLGEETVGNTKLSCVQEEALESVLSILVGVNVNDSYVKNYLDNFKDKGKFDQFVELDNAQAKTIARLGQFISKSISSQSQSLGTGGPSQTIDFNDGSMSI
jgi:uncharacterized protein YegL